MTSFESLTRGVFPAMVTPFDERGRIDHESLAAETRRLETAGVDGLVPVGSTGESATLSHEEHVEVVETVVDAAEAVPVIAGSGSNNTAEALQLSEEAADAGADGLLLISPYYNLPEPAGMREHYLTIADAVDLPQIVYNVPGRTGRAIDAETTAALAEHENIVALKAASGDLGHIGEVAERTADEEFAILSGDDALTLPIMAVGGTGAISVAANVAPGRVGDMIHAALDGELDRARDMHRALGPLFRVLFIETNPIPVKEAVAMQGHCEPSLRSPLSRLAAANRSELEAVLSELDLLPAAVGRTGRS